MRATGRIHACRASKAYGLWPLFNSRFEFALDSEVTNFLREVGPAGVRVDLSPELRWSDRAAGYFFDTRHRLSLYRNMICKMPPYGDPSTPTLTLPYARLDTGLIFERDAGSQGQRTQTLEPRLVYSYVPYRNQNELPIFDTGQPDMNLVELFRTNRYVGGDRIGDANQVAFGMTTRLFNQVHGSSVPVGDHRPDPLFHAAAGVLARRNHADPARADSHHPARTAVSGHLAGAESADSAGANALQRPRARRPQTYRASDIVTEVSLTAYKNWSVNLDYQWNPYTSQTDKSEVLVQYRPDPTKVVNLGYRFQQDILKQYDGSFAWPIAGHWNTVGRWVYSLQDRQTIEQLAGIEYKSCCWRIQVVQRRYLTNRNGGLNTSIALQLELTGLSSVGKPADTFLSKEISGYSTRDPNDPNAQ